MIKTFGRQRLSFRLYLGAAATLALSGAHAAAGVVDGVKSVEGLTVYLGVVPAAISRGHAPDHVEARMHGGAPRPSLHNVHIVAAVFNKTSVARLQNIRVEARIHGTGNNRWTVPLTPMTVNGALTFGGYTSLGREEDVMITLDIVRPERAPRTRTTTVQFRYVHD